MHSAACARLGHPLGPGGMRSKGKSSKAPKSLSCVTLFALVLGHTIVSVAPGFPAAHPFQDEPPGCVEHLRGAIESVDLAQAHALALHYVRKALPERHKAQRECAAAYVDLTDHLFTTEDDIGLAAYRGATGGQDGAGAESAVSFEVADCWGEAGTASPSPWYDCCTDYPHSPRDEAVRASCFGDKSASQCCAMSPFSTSYLALPAIHATSIRIAQPASGRALILEQDGFLRAFDTSTVLWPAAYLLTLWIDAAPKKLFHGRTVVELGAGVGAPSLAVACKGAMAVATDKEYRSLAIIGTNTRLNNLDYAHGQVQALQFDYRTATEDPDSVDALLNVTSRRHGFTKPYDLVLGSSLMFETWFDELWPLLRKLAPSVEDVPRGGEEGDPMQPRLIALSHTKDAILPPEDLFCVIDRIGGETFNLLSRGVKAGSLSTDSDFEVVLLVAKSDAASSCKIIRRLVDVSPAHDVARMRKSSEALPSSGRINFDEHEL